MLKVPVYEEDIYADAAILDPYPHYTRMRELGPLVNLPQYDLYVIARYAETKKALLAHNVFRSGHGVAGYAWPKEFHSGNTLQSDEPVHTRFRTAIGGPLQPKAVADLSERIELAADELVARLATGETIDLMADFARVLPLAIVSSLVGLPERGRERMLDWAAGGFDALGVPNDRAAAGFLLAREMMQFMIEKCSPETVNPDGWTARIWDAVKRGELTAHEAAVCHIDLVAPSLDTTIFAIGHLIHRLATNPDQWASLKAKPELMPSAIDEAIRIESPIRAFARVVDEGQDVGGSELPGGARVLLFYASANRDDRRWDEPERYWIERPGLGGHLGFGQGRHSCVGMHLARLEIRSLLAALLRRVDHVEVGEPTYQVNNVLRGFSAMPTRFYPS